MLCRMRPELNPISPKDRQLLQLYTYNGIGRTLLGFTRPDHAGGRYATVWEVQARMPLYPLGRFYLFEGHTKNLYQVPDVSTTKTNYRFVGKTRLKLTEVVRTYVWAWLMCPAAAALPIWLLIELFHVIDWQNIEPMLLLMALFVIWIALIIALPVGALWGMAVLRSWYQQTNK
jgi:hypothetical protein